MADNDPASTQHPDYVPHERYTVIFKYIDGSSREARVLTNRGETKAVHLATLGQKGLFGGKASLDVLVRHDGPPETDAEGVPVLRGYAIDRNEW
jgi:hypothetical protein